MPFVRLRHGSSGISDPRIISEISRALPKVVAEALDCPDEGGGLTPNHVDVAREQFGLMDITHHDFQVIIDANFFPSRQANLQERRQQIQDALTELIGEQQYKFYVWVRLMIADFGECETPVLKQLMTGEIQPK